MIFWQRGSIPSLSLCLPVCPLESLALMCKILAMMCTYLLNRKNGSKPLVHFLSPMGLLSQFKYSDPKEAFIQLLLVVSMQARAADSSSKTLALGP